MHVLIAGTSGFCDGVKRAMRIAIEAASRHGGLAVDGPLVHNRQAVGLLALHGVADPEADPDNRKPLLVRAHGMVPEERRRHEAAGRVLVDATCVHVARNQRLAGEAAARGLAVVLAGDRDHPEVRAVAGAVDGPCHIVSDVGDVERLELDRKPFLLAQTTFNVRLFERMAAALIRRYPDCECVDTVCRATHERQEEARRLAARADVLVVVGGRHSANTRRLADTGREAGRPVFLVETADELNPGDFAGFRTAAVTSGASTPGWITQEVVNRLRTMGEATPLSAAVRLLHPLVESRLSTALSAGGLALAAEYYLTRGLSPALALAGACYVFFAHTLNRRVPPHPEARRLSLVDAYYLDRRRRLLSLAWLAAGAAVGLSVFGGWAAFILFSAAVLAASLYALSRRMTPCEALPDGRRFNPRNWAMAAAWGLVLAGPPAAVAVGPVSGAGAVFFVFLVCFGGTLIRDLHDIASDRLMGIDTLAARLGPVRARRMAARALGLAAALPFAAALVAARTDGLSSWLMFVLAAPLAPAFGLALLDCLQRRRVHDAVILQAGVDGMGVLAGALALLWGIWP